MPAICRIGDADVDDCSGMTRAVGSPNVFCNSIPISRQTDINTSHEKISYPYCYTHTAPITIGSTTVFINGLGCGRIGDALTDCTAVATGSPNVFSG